jgi:hypothetical protein
MKRVRNGETSRGGEGEGEEREDGHCLRLGNDGRKSVEFRQAGENEELFSCYGELQMGKMIAEENVRLWRKSGWEAGQFARLNQISAQISQSGT